jgi:cytochrome P450
MAGMRRQGAVCPVIAPRRPHAWLVTRYPDVRTLLADDRIRHDMTAKTTDPPEHTRLRCLINRACTAPSVARLRPLLVARIGDILDEFDPDQPIDVVTQFGVPRPVTFSPRPVSYP